MDLVICSTALPGGLNESIGYYEDFMLRCSDLPVLGLITTWVSIGRGSV